MSTVNIIKDILMKMDVDMLEHTQFVICSIKNKIYKNMDIGYHKLSEDFVKNCQPKLIVETLTILNIEKYEENVYKIRKILEKYGNKFGIRYRYGVYDVDVELFLGNYTIHLGKMYNVATVYAVRLSDDKKYVKRHREKHKEKYSNIVGMLLREVLEAINAKNVKSENKRIAVKILYHVTRERKYEKYLDVYVFIIIIHNTEFIELLSSFI